MAKTHRIGRATSAAVGAVPTFVSQKAQSVASAMGDSTPTSVTAVLTTRAAATALQGAQSIDSASAQVWFVEMTGNFVDKNFFGFGTPPTGTEVDFTIDAQTQDILDFGISNAPPDLASLGTVYAIAPNRRPSRRDLLSRILLAPISVVCRCLDAATTMLDLPFASS